MLPRVLAVGVLWCVFASAEAAVILTPGNGSRIETVVTANGVETITLSALPATVEYVIVQVHSYLYNVTLSYIPTVASGSSTSGTDIGLILSKGAGQVPLTSTLYVINAQNVTVDVLIAFDGYDNNAPVPGGCSMVLPVKTAPFLPTTFTMNVVSVEVPLASWPMNGLPLPCERAPLQYDIYEYYLTERDFSVRKAFDSIRKMIDIPSIQLYGKKVNYFGTPMSRIKFANYAGTGRVVVVIARTLTESAAYVPSLSYGCNVFSEDEQDTCQVLGSTAAKLLSAFLIFVGLFLTFLGHRFYKNQLFFLGYCVSAILFYIVLASVVDVGITVAGMTALSVGAVGGAMWLALWARWGAPVAPIFLASVVLGVLFASIIAYTPLGDLQLLKETATFWLAFMCLVLVVPLVIISYGRMTSILWCTVVGSYLFLVPVDHYVGSNLKYIILNTLRRVTDSDFGPSIINPPFGIPDIILTVVWVFLIVTGTAFQCWRERGRAPFPPAPSWPSRRPTTTTDDNPTEATHLLS